MKDKRSVLISDGGIFSDFLCSLCWTQVMFILFDQGKKLGEISDWTVQALPPVYKNVLGKTVLSTPANNECRFVSPKPVKRKSILSIIEDGKWEYLLQIVSVKEATLVTAKILEKKNVGR